MPPLVVIVGATASGKSALAMEIAEKHRGELVCADSWTVYEGFDIGTAKPSAEDRARVPHHLLDVADPAKGYSAAIFQRQAKQVIADISARGKLPIMVGGTGLYIDSVLYDYSFLPPADPALRETLNALTLEEVVARAEELGLDTTDIDLRNKRRVIRLIENNGIRPNKGSLRENTLILGIALEREHLREAIMQRVNIMLEQGLEAEVRTLAERYGWEAEPMKGIGYREWREYFDGRQSLAETEERIVRASMDLARRQFTWFKHNPRIHWLHDRSNYEDILTTYLNKSD